ncbi:MAG TPA: TonB-dependent receptor [Deltaproteobacteria bacterium]|nr:TonB-dependent receptor [Deltaproteobacteria bacterium]
MRWLVVMVAMVFCCPLIAGSESHAASSLKRNSEVYELGEVVVQGTPLGVESIGTVRETPAQYIQEKGTTDVSKVINYLPGIHTRLAPEGVPRVDIRGFRSRHVLLLLDGVPLNSTYDGQFDPAILPVENIADIKVSYGTHSVLYGEGGLGGVINIITKKGQEGLRGMVNGEAGDSDYYLMRSAVSGAKGPVNFFLSGSLSERDAFKVSDNFHATSLQDEGKRDNSDFQKKNLFANIGFTPTDKTKLGFVFSTAQGQYGKPPSTLSKSTDPFANNAKYERVESYRNYSWQGSGSHEITDRLSLRGWVFFNKLNEKEKSYDDNTYSNISTNGKFSQTSETDSSGAALQTRYDLKKAGFLTLGLNGRKDEWDARGVKYERVGSGRNARVESKPINDDKETSTYTAALEYEVSPVKDLGIVLGYAHNWFDPEEQADNLNKGNFLAGLTYDVRNGTRVKGSFAKGVRFPSIKQLYDATSGNEDLKAETAYTYEAGIEQSLPWKSTLSVTGFLINAKDYIEKRDSSDTYENYQKYRFQGIEVVAENRYFNNIWFRAGYTLLSAKDRSHGTQVDDLQYRPRHKFTFETGYKSSFGLSAYAGMRYLASQYTYSDDYRKKSLRNYAVVDAKIEQALIRDTLSLYVLVENLFDRNYEESYGFPQAGRTVFGGATVRF